MNLMTLLRLLLACVSLLPAHTVSAEDMCVVGDLRLIVDRETDLTIEGSVQLCYNGVWSEVCRSDTSQPGYSGTTGEWGLHEATVACRQLGYSDQGTEYKTHCNSSGTTFITLNCNDGEESNLQGCNPQFMRNSICSCTDGVLELHAKVVCKKVCSDGEMRLVEGPTHREGRVEVCVDGRWGTVSNNSQEGIAGAVCSRLGFPAEGAVVRLIHEAFSEYGRRGFVCTVSICTNSHSSESPGLELRCLSHQDVVSKESFCAGNQEGHFRLVNGSSPNEGRVEMCMNGGWRPVCGSGQNGTALAVSVCSALAYSEEDPQIRSYDFGQRNAVCCSNSKTNITCEHCNSTCRQTMGVICQACQQVIQQITERTTSQSSVTLTDTIQERPSLSIATFSNIVTPLGLVSGFLVAALLVTVIGWIVTCIAWKRFVIRKALSVSDPIMHRNESYSTHQLNNRLHSVATPTTINSSLTGPYDDIILPGREDVMDHSHQNSDPQLVEVVNPTPVRDEASKKEDDFYDAEEHNYSVVNKKKAKKTSEDGEGEREEPQDYETAVPGETSWGVMDEETV